MPYQCENFVYKSENDYYMSYILRDNSYFYNTNYQILKNNNEKCFIKPYKVNYNGAIKLIYITENLTEIGKYVKRAKINEIMQLVENIFNKIIEIDKAGFVKKETIDISDKHMFVDDEGNIQFLCVPISITSTIETQNAFNAMLKSKVAELLIMVSKAGNSLFNMLISDCNDVNMSVTDMYMALKEKKYGIYDIKEDSSSQTGMQENVFGYFALESTDKTHADIVVTKKKAILGKSKKEADYIISEAFISRQHCELAYSDNRIYIKDMGSTNGTYLNGIRIPANVYMPVDIGDNIAFSSLSYIVTGGYSL